MSIEGKVIAMRIAGLGIVFHSPKWTDQISEGADYLSSNYMTEHQVQAHIQKGTIVGFGTGSSGDFELRLHIGYPNEAALQAADFKLRLGLTCAGGCICFRDLCELMDWKRSCSPERIVQLDDGFYHVTLCSNLPQSGIIGDDQVIDVFFQNWIYSQSLQTKASLRSACCKTNVALPVIPACTAGDVNSARQPLARVVT